MRSRIGLAFGLASIALCAALPAHAEYPDRPIRVLVGFAAGGGADIMVRWFSEKLRAESGAVVVVENKPGAGANLAQDTVAKAKPDGYTLLMTASSSLAGNAYVYKNLPYDPIKDFAPITSLSELGFVLAINPERTPVKNVAEFTELMKAKGGKATYGIATTTALASSALYLAATGLDATQVAYKATATALSDLAANQIDFVFADATFAIQQAKQGRIKLIAVTTAKRMNSAPDLPTFLEQGFNVELAPWWAAYAPAGTPPEITRKLEGWLGKAVTLPETKDFLLQQGADPLPGSADFVRDRLAQEMQRWARITSLAKIEPQ
jgi:tripartite-type tricarboxylate transporter receptor subunit TctC